MNKTKKRTEPTTLYLGHVKFHRMCAPRNVIIACKHVGLALSVSSKQHSNPIQNITEVFLDVSFEACELRFLQMHFVFHCMSPFVWGRSFF